MTKLQQIVNILNQKPEAKAQMIQRVTELEKEKADWKPLEDMPVASQSRLQANRENFDSQIALMKQALELSN